MPQRTHLLINALSASYGGGSVVVREMARHLAIVRPDWTISLLLTRGKPAHDQLRTDLRGARLNLVDAPASTAGVASRWLWENRKLGPLLKSIGATVLLQPNGMVPRGIDVPVFAHVGDPWAYHAVRDRWFDPAIACMRRRGHRRAFRVADAMGFTSRYLMELMCERFHAVPAGRADVYYNGVPPEQLRRAGLRDTVPLQDRPHELVSVSRVSPYKGQHLVVRALPEVIRATGWTDLRYRVIGAGDAFAIRHLRRAIDETGMQSHVTIEGQMPFDQLSGPYLAARAMVLPSSSESFGLPAIEAMSFGTPVVVARAAAVPEICVDAAEYCDLADPPSLARALVRAVADVERAEQLRRAGWDNVLRFDWQRTALTLAETLLSLQRDVDDARYARP